MSASMMMGVAAQQAVLANAGGGGDSVVSGQFTLKSTGGQYIDTAITPTDTTPIEVRCKRTGTQGNTPPYDLAGIVFGAFNGSSNLMDIDFNSDTEQIKFPVKSTQYVLYSNPSILDTYYEVGRDSATHIYLNDASGTEITNRSVSGGTAVTSTAWLFGLNFTSPYTYKFVGNVDSLKIWSDVTKTTLLCDMWPVPGGRRGQGAISLAAEDCMYDSVSSNYFYNQGTGAFTTEEL